ncbi:MAG: hypothetical protein A2015_02955 [Spirochaetes bacterium GWF1_31_7]|nr:MAG: hypothetical protein A2Y30_12335 [Spirochaetes bacterium GWE1_32_154]OHD46137.1 MAG: hypothetical protein A2Y29_07045 [Spirochaetes bacterium GWE2_31_10]OHD47536.1 MAG: hypothetical protein A2015_02955 [Spirochaetes bacterium GWF1_31_7]
MIKKKIVVIGAGYAGVHAVKELEHTIGKKTEITLIDKHPYHTLMTELHEVAGSRVDVDSVKVSLDTLFSGKNVSVIIDKVETVDFDKQIIKTCNSQFEYDYLIIATGAEPVFFNIPGVRDYSYTLWSLEDAIKLRRHIEDSFFMASKEYDVEKRKQLLRFVIAGGGFTGIEMAGELIEWQKKLVEEYRINPNEVELILVEAMGCILPLFDADLQKKSMKYLTKKGVTVMVNSKITEVNKNGEIFTKNGDKIFSNTLIWTCGVEGGTFAGNLNIKKGKSVLWECDINDPNKQCTIIEGSSDKSQSYEKAFGRILVRQTMQSESFDNVYIAGDIVWFINNAKPLPQIVETAIQTGKKTAHNIIASIQGKPLKNLKPVYHGFMVSIGSSFAVASIMNIKMSGFIAIAFKHLINIHYMYEITKLNGIWGYIRNHFLDVHDNRSCIGGHATKKVRIYWVILLRIFLGIMWLTQGGSKIADGWLNPETIYIVNISDSVTAATSEESSAPESDEKSSENTNAIFKEPPGVYTWFEESVIKKAPFVFQAGVVITEVLFGLAFIGGLFTFMAAIGSLGMVIMFIVSGMAGYDVLWYFFSGIVMLGGAGRGFGLDYWVIPRIKKWWNGLHLVKKLYLFIDEPVCKKKKIKDAQ